MIRVLVGSGLRFVEIQSPTAGHEGSKHVRTTAWVLVKSNVLWSRAVSLTRAWWITAWELVGRESVHDSCEGKPLKGEA